MWPVCHADKVSRAEEELWGEAEVSSLSAHHYTENTLLLSQKVQGNFLTCYQRGGSCSGLSDTNAFPPSVRLCKVSGTVCSVLHSRASLLTPGCFEYMGILCQVCYAVNTISAKTHEKTGSSDSPHITAMRSREKNLLVIQSYQHNDAHPSRDR